MKWKTLFLLVLVALVLLKIKICNAGTKSISAEEDNEESVTTGKERGNIYPRNENNIFTMRKLAMRRLAKRHKTGVSTRTGVRTSASSTFERVRPPFATEVPIQRKVKLPVILTSLPTSDEDRFFSKTNGEGAGHGSSKFNTQAKDKSDINHDHSEHAQDIPKPRITEQDRLTQGGTNSKAHQHKPSAHYEMPSSGLRWTVYHLRTGDQNETKKRYKKRKKRAAPQQIDDEREEPVTDEDDGEEQSRSSVNFALVGAGIVVFLFIFAGLACLWRTYKKRCLRRKHPDLTSSSERLSQEEKINCETRTSRDSDSHQPKPNPSSYQLAATHFDAQSPWTVTDTPSLMAVSPRENTYVVVDIPDSNLASEAHTACSIVDLSESSPVCVVVDAPQADSHEVVDVPDKSSPDTSFTCSSLSNVFSWFSSSSLTSVSSLDMTSAEPEASSLIPELVVQCSSLTPISRKTLKAETELNDDQIISSTVEPEIVIDVPRSEPPIPLTIEPESSLPLAEKQALLESCLLIHPASPKQSSLFSLPASTSDEATRILALDTENVNSSQLSCKTPLAVTGDVMLTIQDEGEVFLRACKTSGAETTMMSRNSENEKHVLRNVESRSPASDTSGLSTKTSAQDSGMKGNVKDSCAAKAENGNDGVTLIKNVVVIDTSRATDLPENPEIEKESEISDVTSQQKDGVMVIGKGTIEISGLTCGNKEFLTMTMGRNHGGTPSTVTRSLEENSTAEANSSLSASNSENRAKLMDHPDREVYEPKQSPWGADSRSPTNFAGKENERREKEITSSATGTGEKKPQVGESSKESGKDEKRSSDQRRLRNKDRPDRALYKPPRKGHLGADPRSTVNFGGKEKEKKEKEITSSVTGTGEKKPQVGESSKESGKDEKENGHYQRVQRVRNKDRPDRALYQPPRKGHLGADPRSTANFAGKGKEKKQKEITSSVTGTSEKKPQLGESSKESGKDEMENSHYQRVQRVRNKDRPDRALYQPPRKGHLGADPRSTANFAGKEKEKKEQEITSSVTGTGEKKPQVGESSKESEKDEKRDSHYQRVQRVRNKNRPDRALYQPPRTEGHLGAEPRSTRDTIASEKDKSKDVKTKEKNRERNQTRKTRDDKPRDKDRYRYRDDHSERDRDRRGDRGRTRDKACDRDQGSDRSLDTEASKEEEDKSKNKRGHDYETKKASEHRFRRFSSNSAE